MSEPGAPIDVVAAVIRRGDRWLVARRPRHKRHGDLWEFPGGKVDPGESLEQAMQRELDEELGVTMTSVSLPEVWARVDEGGRFRILFIHTEIDGEPRAIEHSELRWAKVDELREMELAPSDAEFVERYLGRAGDGARR